MIVGKREGGTSWKIGEEIMEDVEEFKYLGVRFDRKLRGDVYLEMMPNEPEEWVGKVMWMSRVNGQEEIVREWMVWDLMWMSRVNGHVEIVREWMVWDLMWMSRVNGHVEIVREWMVWDLMGRPSVEHAAEEWRSGGHSACRKLESAQVRVGSRLLEASNTVAGVAVQGDLGWRKAEGVEGRDESVVW